QEDVMNDKDEGSDDEKKLEDQDRFGYGAISVYFFNAKDIEKNGTANGNVPVPLAALHLHYRSTQWLLKENIIVKDEVFNEIQANQEAQQEVQETKESRPEAKRKTRQTTRKGKNKKEKIEETTSTEAENPTTGSDCDISEWTGKLDLGEAEENEVTQEQNQEQKKKPRGKKEKKNVGAVKDEAESNAAKRYNLRARK